MSARRRTPRGATWLFVVPMLCRRRLPLQDAGVLLGGRSGHGFPPEWSQIEWLHVTDMEALAQLADDGTLDLAALFLARGRGAERFDTFLYKQYGSILVDAVLVDDGATLLQRASRRYFQSS